MVMHHLLKHRYQILRVLSEAGGFGQTFLAEVTDTPSRRRCVIKKLRPIADPKDFKLAQERFQREAAVLERLSDSSDRIPKLYAYFVENQEFYLVQELIEGPTLRQIARHGMPLSEKAVGDLLVDLLSVLAYVHEQNVIHRDIKPDNVILRRRDNKPVLIDFGIVKEVMHVGDASSTRSMMTGTPGYISLEQAAGRPVFASDLYSLGATAIFLLTGKNPRCMTDPATGQIHWREHVPEVSPDFAVVLDKSTEPYVHNRYQTAGQMSDDLRKAFHLNEHVVAPQPASAIEEETVIRPAALHLPTPNPQLPSYALYFVIAATVLGLLTVIGSAAMLARLGVQSHAENMATKDKLSSRKQDVPTEKLRQVSTNKATTAEAKRPRIQLSPTTPATIMLTPKEGSQTSSETANVRGIFPEASTRLLTQSDLVGRSLWELRVMRNEIFARHGYIFKTPEMISYFSLQRWYNPRYDDISSFLSELEVRNAKMIKSSE
jgi:serine/threonine protein kinase, bacterial